MHIKYEYHIIKMDALSTRSRGLVDQKHHIVSVVSPGGMTLTLLRTDNAEAVKRLVDGVAAAVDRGDALFDVDLMMMTA